jgi:hypothetical protein
MAIGMYSKPTLEQVYGPKSVERGIKSNHSKRKDSISWLTP